MFLVDKDNKYYHLALKELGDEVWTIDSYAFNSAMHLSQELTNCQVTALNILDNLDSRYGLQGKMFYLSLIVLIIHMICLPINMR